MPNPTTPGLTSQLRQFYSITHGHYSEDAQGELWGLATHPTKPLYATAGEDRTVRIWNFQTKKVRLEAWCGGGRGGEGGVGWGGGGGGIGFEEGG